MPLIDHVTQSVSHRVIGAAISVHHQLGPGLLESAYRQCLLWELTARGVDCRSEVPVGVVYRGHAMEAGFRLDLLVEGRLVVELKSCDRVLPIHKSQIITYLRRTGLQAGLIINFNVERLKDGVRRVLL